MSDQLARLLAAANGQQADPYKAVFEGDAALHAERLRDRLQSYQTKNDFKPGMIVRWKRGMKSQNLPKYGEPLIVVQVFDPPLPPLQDEHHCPEFHDPVDMALGWITGNDFFGVFKASATRFEPIPEKELEIVPAKNEGGA